MKINGITVANTELFNAYAQWLGRCMTETRQLAHYGCPRCMSRLYAAVPPVGGASDTMTTCPICAGMFFKIVDNENGDPVVSTYIVPHR
jgi:LDH2 family malate/lactate/ureidoglycolate dehydrogenase